MSSPKEKSRPLSHQSETYGYTKQQKDKQQEADFDSFSQKVSSFASQEFNEKPKKLMTNELKEYWKKQLPLGFQFYLERLARSIIRHQPENIIEFAALYFEKVYSLKNAEISNLPKESYFVKLFKKNLSEPKKKQKQHWRPEDTFNLLHIPNITLTEVDTCQSEPHAESDENLSLKSLVKPLLTLFAVPKETRLIETKSEERQEEDGNCVLDEFKVEAVRQALRSDNSSDQCEYISNQGNCMKTEMADIIHGEILKFICSPDIVASCHPTEVIEKDLLCKQTEDTDLIHIKDRLYLAQETLENHCPMNSSAYMETNDMYIAQTYRVHGMLHETKYYQNGSVTEDGTLGNNQQVSDSNISNKNLEMVIDQNVSGLWHPLIQHDTSHELVDARGDQLSDHLVLETERKVKLTNYKDGNYFKHSLVTSPLEQQNQVSVHVITEGVNNYEVTLEEENIQDCPAFRSPWQVQGQRRLKTEAVMNELVLKKESFFICQDSFLENTEMYETSFINANFCHIDEKFIHNQIEEMFPPSPSVTRNSQTDEDSIGEDIQARFRAEQNTYFIPIRSESELTQAGWDVAHDDSTLAHGESVFNETAAEPSPKNCCCTAEEDLKMYCQYGDQNEANLHWNESSRTPAAQDAQSCIIYDAEGGYCEQTFGAENSVTCNIGENEDSGYSITKDAASIADNYICELKRVSQNIEKIIDEQIQRDSDNSDPEMSGEWTYQKILLENPIAIDSGEVKDYFVLQAFDKDNVTCSNQEECLSTYYVAEKLSSNVNSDNNDCSSFSGKELIDCFENSFHDLGHISKALSDQNVEGNICFGSSLDKVQLQNEGEHILGPCKNMNNNGNTGSSNSAEIKSGDAMSSSKAEREGVIIYEKDPSHKGAQIDFLILEGNQIFSIPKEAIVRNTWRDYYKPCNVNNSKTDETTESELTVNSDSQNVHGWQATDEHSNETCDSSLLEEFTCDCLPKPCSSTVSAKSKELKPQVLAASTKKRDEMKTRKVMPITRICTQLSQPKTYESGANKTYEKQQSASPHSPMFYSPRQRSSESRNFSPETFNNSSPKSRSFSPKTPKSRTFSPKSPKSRTFSPKSPKTRIFSPKAAKPKIFSSKSPKPRTFSPNSTNSRNFSPKSPKVRAFSPKSPKSRVLSPNSSKPRAYSPKLPKPKQRPSHSPTIKVKGSSSHEKVQKKNVFYSHDHTGASYILQPRGISYTGKKTKSWTEINKPPSKKSPIGTALPSRVKKSRGTGCKNSKKFQIKKKQDSTFPLSLHTFYDPCSATSCYIPETTRQLTIESPKENLMVHTTYVRPNPLQPNIRGIFELISKKQRLYLGDNERAISSDETRQLICETECFVTRDSKKKHLILENGTLSDPAPKVVTRSSRSTKKIEKSLSESKSQTKNLSNLTSGKTKPKKRSWANHNYVELIGDFVYIGRQSTKYAQNKNYTNQNRNSNAQVDSVNSESLSQVVMGSLCDHLIGCMDTLGCSISRVVDAPFGGSIGNHLADASSRYFSQNALVNRNIKIFDPKEFYSPWKHKNDPSGELTLNVGLKYNVNNNSAAELTSDLEDTTLQDIDQIITEHPQLNSLKHKPSRRSRPNSPSKRSMKGKCLECEPSVTGDVEEKHFLDFEHQVQATEINSSEEAQTGSSLETRANVLPFRNKSVKMGHKLWNSCMCEPPRPYVSPQYAECSIQLNMEDICCSTASQTGDGHEKTYIGHAVDIDHITMCECQKKNKHTRKRHFDTQVHADEICPSNTAQTGSSLLLLEPLASSPNENTEQGVKTGHAFKLDYSDCEQLGKCAKPEIVECSEIETQVMATDINPCADAQTGSSVMLTEPFPPIKPVMSDEEYPEEDVTWGDLSIYDMPSENKSVFAYYKRYEDLTKLEKDYEIYAKPYKTAAHPQVTEQKNVSANEGKLGGAFYSVGFKPEVQKIMSVSGLDSKEEYKQYIPAYYHESGEIRDHEQGEFRNVARQKESVTITSFNRQDSLDPTLSGPRKEKYSKFKQNAQIEDMKNLSEEDEGQAEDENTKEDTQETTSHKPYRRRRKPTSGPSIETQTIKTSRTISQKQED